MAGMSQTRSLIIREELTEKCAALLMAYRVQCAAATRLTQVCCEISSKTIVHFDFFSLANYSGGIPRPSGVHTWPTKNETTQR